jgi:hypothetical protein
MTLTFTLARQTHVLFLGGALIYLHAGGGAVGLNLNIDGTLINAAYLFTNVIKGTSGTMFYVATLAAGTHTVKMQIIGLAGATTVGVENKLLSYVVLGN